MRPDLTLLTAFTLDRWLGELRERLHPVVRMGRSIAWSFGLAEILEARRAEG